MPALRPRKVVGMLAALTVAWCAQATLGSGRAAARPPLVSSVQCAALAAHASVWQPAERARVTTAETARPRPQRPNARSDRPPPRTPRVPPPLPPLRSRLEGLGGAHAKRAMQVAQGITTGPVALRPMFWITRDRRGGVVALGGRF